MDGPRFDELTKAFAAGASRRAVLRGLLGTAGGLLGLGGASRALGQQCRPAGRLCNKNANCCSDFCDTENEDPFLRKRCACLPPTVECRGLCRLPEEFLSDPEHCGECGNRCPRDVCNLATCVEGRCDLEPDPARVGKACDDNDLCTLNDLCQADGSCAGTPVDCSDLDDQCNVGVCDPATGGCVPQPRDNGTPCELSPANLCTADTCQTGVCTLGPVNVTCPAPTQCQASVSCTPATGLCTTIVNQQPGFPCGAGPSCTNGVQHAQDTCNADGTCVPGADTCSAYACGTTTFLTTCDDDEDCAAAARCVDGACRCRALVLSGGPNATDTIEIDDDLTVYLNGNPIFADTDGLQNFFPPIAIPGEFGDTLRVVGNDVFGFEWAISPLYLHCPALETACPALETVQVLDAEGFRICCEQPVGGVFYDMTFTIAL